MPSEIIKEIGKRTWRRVKGKRTEEKPGRPSSCVSLSQTATQSRTLSSLRFLRSTHTESGTPASPERQLLVPLSPPRALVYQPLLLRNVALFTDQTSTPRDNSNHILSSKNSVPKCTMPSFIHTGKHRATAWTLLRSLWERGLEWSTHQS